MTVDEELYPQGYLIETRRTTGIKLDLTLSELFHQNAHGWQARPTITSTQFNILEGSGYDPDKIVAVFDAATPQARIDEIIAGGSLDVAFHDPTPPQIYLLAFGPEHNLRTAHSYLRKQPEIAAAAPSMHIVDRGVVPSEGTPDALRVIDAEAGWEKAQLLLGDVGKADVTLAVISNGSVDVDHPDIWPNVWLSQQEVLAHCPASSCDVDRDGLVTLRDFNDSRFPADRPRPGPGADGVYTCADLLADGSPYVDGVDNGPGNGLVDDICGWNYADTLESTKGSRWVNKGPFDNHDSAVAGIMASVGDGGGPAVGVCWRCRLMPIVVSQPAVSEIGLPADAEQIAAEGATAEVLAAFRYARTERAIVANFSAGMSIRRDDTEGCGTAVPTKAYETLVSELRVATFLAVNEGDVALEALS